MTAGPAMQPGVVLGVDVGTTAVKVQPFGVGGWQPAASQHAVSVREHPPLQPVPGWLVQDVDVVLAGLRDALRESVSALDGVPVVGLSISSALHALVGLDATLRPLTPLVTWADSRSAEESRALHRSGQARAIHRRSGTPVHPMSPLTKLMWFSRHEPALCARVRWWAGLKDVVIAHLTGTVATELSTASASGLLDGRTLQWAPDHLDLAGVDAERLPPVLDTTATLPLAAAVAADVGLTAGTPVVIGAGDGPLGNLGTGAIAPGVASLSLGTSGAVRAVVPADVPLDSDHLFRYALTRDRWVMGGAISNGGAVIRWAAGAFGDACGADGDEQLLDLAASVPQGSEGLVMLPYLLAERAPAWDPDLQGAFLGIRHHHRRAHFVRAAVEGVAVQLAAVVGQLDAVQPVSSVRATGGAFRSHLWREVVAAAVARPFQVTTGAGGSARGAAALGLHALGVAPTLDEAAELLLPTEAYGAQVVVSPDSEAAYERVRLGVPAMLAAYQAVALALAGPVRTG